MNTTQPSLTRSKRMQNAIVRFVAAPASPKPLAVFRILVAGVLLMQALSIAGSIQDLYGERSIVQWSTLGNPQNGISILPDTTHLAWLAKQLAPLGVTVDDCVRGMFLLYVLSLSGLLLGWRSNFSAMIAWLLHLAMNHTGFATIYGVDQFANISLFYCMWMPVGHALSLDCQSGRVKQQATTRARISLRVLQGHLSIAYLATGLEKAVGEQWWNGEAIWRATTLPELAQFDFTWLANVPSLAVAVCLATLIIEVGYPLLIWPTVTRKPMAFAVIGLHASIAMILGLVSFSALMASLTFSAFVINAEPKPGEAVEPIPNELQKLVTISAA
ncbi:MAG: hypothetical protein Tsb009_36040 [Planctomycetaceae bacterium]